MVQVLQRQSHVVQEAPRRGVSPSAESPLIQKWVDSRAAPLVKGNSFDSLGVYEVVWFGMIVLCCQTSFWPSTLNHCCFFCARVLLLAWRVEQHLMLSLGANAVWLQSVSVGISSVLKNVTLAPPQAWSSAAWSRCATNCEPETKSLSLWQGVAAPVKSPLLFFGVLNISYCLLNTNKLK